MRFERPSFVGVGKHSPKVGSRMRSQGTTAIPHPIPYQGSKRALAPTIIAHFPRHADRLIEPFAGSAAVTLSAAYHGKVKRFLLNDINQPLINLWDDMIHMPEATADAYEGLWQAQQGQERKFYDLVRAKFNHTQRPDFFLYLLARCVKASVRYNPNGEFNQSPDNRRKSARPATMRGRILGASRLLRGTTELACIDYREVLAGTKPSDIVYMDPPYQGVSEGKDRRYIGSPSFDVDAFVDALHALNTRGVSFVVSYDGRTGDKRFGKTLPESLDLVRLEVDVGRSSQATLLGRDDSTFESLYLSPALVNNIGEFPALASRKHTYRYPLLPATP